MVLAFQKAGAADIPDLSQKSGCESVTRYQENQTA
jgi:hypothetical protein